MRRFALGKAGLNSDEQSSIDLNLILIYPESL